VGVDFFTPLLFAAVGRREEGNWAHFHVGFSNQDGRNVRERERGRKYLW
jgi:hypothetical protein